MPALGSGKRRRMTKYSLGELSMVDRAQQPTPTLIFKRKGDPDYDPKNPDASKRGRFEKHDGIVLITSLEGRHTHGMSIGRGMRGGSTWYSEDPQDERSHDHPWMFDTDGSIIIGDNMGHGHSIDRASLLQAFMSLGPASRTDPDVVAFAEKCFVKFTEDGGVTDLLTKEGDMPNPDLEKTVQDLQAKLKVATALSTMNDAQKAYYAALPEADQPAFLEKSDADRAAVIEKAQAEDPVVFTTATGVEIRKSDGPVVLALAQDAAAANKRADEAETISKRARFEKAATEHLGHLPGSIDVRCAIVKALDGIDDEAVRSLAAQSLIAADRAMAGVYTRKGAGPDPNAPALPGGENPNQKLDALTKRFQDDNPGTSYVDAYEKVAEANPDLAEAAILAGN